ncbi:Alpha/beta hydrolase family protein [Thalassoglobus neptunius]|uniref:Alpha/beta hydrolase family protein n=1 Tax=Thalassoglobus neptunius TaxID=1938619 RepID=A0A5C5WZ13_9PLAN|nr:alpha/beta hydrolase [Thalassoglobus neptunius]TWT55790.1 Alpha/beta hydrolase family protein [Thalassoglobus neptunius]
MPSLRQPDVRLQTALSLFVVWVAVSGFAERGAVYAQEAESFWDNSLSEISTLIPGKLAIPQFDSKTLGGRLFWGDVRFFRGYRIQHNVLTGHYRLLDPFDVRRKAGSREECDRALEEIILEKQLEPMTGTAVVVIHGIARSSKSMTKMCRELEKAGYVVVNFDYPSTRLPLAQSTSYLSQTLASLEGVEKVHFACWSMGGLLVRSYLRDYAEQRDPRVGRMVMMGTPNQGAELATLLQKNFAFRFVFGPAGQELIAHPDGPVKSLPVPDFEFGIIAGARGNERGWNPFIPGDDDGTVSVESTRLEGASDFLVVKALHSFICLQPETIEAVKNFFETGAFREDGERDPVLKLTSDVDQSETVDPLGENSQDRSA